MLDEINKIRRIILEKDGKFTLKECERIAAALEVDNVSLVAMLEAIRKDLFPQKFVLNLKDAERFQLLRTALQKNTEHVLLKKIAPELAVLAENFKKPQADDEACRKAIDKLRVQIKPYTEKVPKLVKYLNEYADLCEANFLNVLRLKVLRINLRFLPLLKEANGLFTACDNTSDNEVYWKMAEQLYLNYSSLFKEEVYYFSVIRGILDAFYRNAGQEPILLDVPTEISLIEENLPEEEVAVVEEKREEVAEVIENIETEDRVSEDQPDIAIAEEVVEEIAAEVPEAIEETEIPEKVEDIEVPEAVVEEKTEVESIEEEVPEGIEEEVVDVPVEQLKSEQGQVQPEMPQDEPEIQPDVSAIETVIEPIVEAESVESEVKQPEPEIKQPEPEKEEKISSVQKRSKKPLYMVGGCFLLIIIVCCLYFINGTKTDQSPVIPVIVTDTIRVAAEDTVVAAPAVTPEKVPVPKTAEQQDKPKVEQQSQPKIQPEASPAVDKPQEQAEPAKVEKKVQANSLEAAREATQNGDYKKAFDIYKSLADAGNAEAQYCLGIMYETGKGVDIDIFEAVMWYRKAKAKGFAMAERKLQELGYN